MKPKKTLRRKLLPWLLALVSAPLLVTGVTIGSAVYGQQNQGLIAEKVSQDPMKLLADDGLWSKVPAQTIKLMAQPIALPRPKLTLTEQIEVKTVHDGKNIAFRLSWKDSEKSEAGKLGIFSDAVAMEFPVKLDKDQPPSPFMGELNKPVHIFHWRAQYQKDKEVGHSPEMTDLYPNMSVDSYPMEYKDPEAPEGSDAQKRQFSPGQVTGNPQSYVKDGIDEIFAEGFGSSSVAAKHGSRGAGVWQNGTWSVVISRSISSELGSHLVVGGKNFVCFAIWQGGQREVGSRKSVSLMWVDLNLKP